jgi:hypothetical protein
MTDILKIYIKSKTENGIRALKEALFETDILLHPAKILADNTISRARKLKLITKGRMVRNQYELTLDIEEPYIVLYSVKVFNNSAGFVYADPKFQQGIDDFMFKYGATKEDYVWGLNK